MLAGHVKGQKRSLSSMFEAVGANAAGTLSDEICANLRTKYVQHADLVLVCIQPTV